MLTRRQLIASMAGLLLAGPVSGIQAQDISDLEINSKRYIVTNADTGAIFGQREAHKQVAIASLTKIFTAIEAVNVAPLDTEITTTDDDLQSADATVMGFGPGETFTLEELVYGMLLPSGNDAAHAIARSLGYQEGDTAEEAVQRFMDLVNERVKLMGLKDTNLVNPDGWGVPDHYSSAADVAAFMAYASRNEFVLTVLGTSRFTTNAGYTLVNTNKVLSSSPSVLGGKTGYDWDSGWCLVQIAQRESTRVIAVTLDGIAPDDWYNDNLVLLDYAFDQQKALGSSEFDGDFVTWADPAPKLFAQAGPAAASITGKSDDGQQVATSEEIQAQPAQVARDESISASFDGRESSAILAGVGVTALGIGMATTRWMDHGGDGTAQTMRPSLAAITGSIKRGVPLLPNRPDADMSTQTQPDEPSPDDVHFESSSQKNDSEPKDVDDHNDDIDSINFMRSSET